MVDSLGWVDAVAGDPMYTGRMLRQLNGVAFAGATAARPLGARSGVRPGTPSSTVTATSTTWTCQPFAGLLDGQTAAEAGAYPFAFDAVAAGALTAADASNPRVDIIYVQVDDPSESDGSTLPAVTRKYLAGTASATPAVPATPARSIVIAHINVPKSGGGAPTVTWVAPYVAAAGGVQDFNTKAQMEAWVTAPLGQRAKVLATGVEYVRTSAGVWRALGVSAFTRPTSNMATSGPMVNMTLMSPVVDLGAFTHSNGVFTCVVAGTYRVTAGVNFQNHASGVRTAKLIHSVLGNRTDQKAANGANEVFIGLSWVAEFAVGNTITLQGQQSSGGNLGVAADVEFEAI